MIFIRPIVDSTACPVLSFIVVSLVLVDSDIKV